MDKSSRPPKPYYIKCGTPREDGFLFSGWMWKREKWQQTWRAPEKYRSGRDRCRKLVVKKYQDRAGNAVAAIMCRGAKDRAKAKCLPFDITPDDIVVPEFCPVLPTIRLVSRYGKKLDDSSPTLDRIIPELGYVRGNILVVSHLANRIKTNATPEQIQAVATFYSNLKPYAP